MIRLYEEFENQPHRPPNCPKSLKIEAIQTSLFVDVPDVLSAMPKPLPASLRSRILRLLLLHWASWAIAEEVHCCSATVYNIQENLFMYNSSFRSQFRSKEVLCKMFKIAENDLIVYLEEQSWVMQKEIIWYIWEKRNINVHWFTISRILKRRRWSNKKEQHVEIRQNDELCLNWIADMLHLTIEQLMFINESLFNKITDWRHQAYAFVDQSARYQVFKTREHCWSVLSIYTKDEYLFCTDIRENWFNDKTFFQWLADELLFLCSFFSTSRSVIIMNNASVHCNSRIEKLIISHEYQINYFIYLVELMIYHWYECQMWYLSSYSLNYNLIELIFNVLKIWVCKHFDEIWSHFENIFDDFLHYAVEWSKCNKYSKQHFKHSNYIFETDIKALKWELKIEIQKFNSI